MTIQGIKQNPEATKEDLRRMSLVMNEAIKQLNDGTYLKEIVEDTSPQLGGDLDTNGHQVQWSKGADVASASALPILTDGNYFDVTGNTTITSINTTGKVGTVIKLHFDGVLTLTHNATDLVLPGGANITTAAGDEAEFIEYASGDYRCTIYSKADGTAVVSGGGGAWSLIETQAASTSPTIDFTSGIDSAYDTYVFVISGLRPASAADLWVRMGNGGSFDSGGSDYSYANDSISAGGVRAASSQEGDAQIILSTANVFNDSRSGYEATFYMNRAADSSSYTRINGTYFYDTDAGTGRVAGYGGGTRDEVAAHDRVQFLMSTGNITEGRFTLYGVSYS